MKNPLILSLLFALTAPLAQAQLAAPAGSQLDIAHRGASAYAPEHTFFAYDLALEMDVDMLECDLILTKDEVPVCIHDETVERTTGATTSGRVDSFTLAQMRQMDFGSWFNTANPTRARPEYAGARIVPFEEQLDCYLGHNALMRFHVETKDSAGGRAEAVLVDLLTRKGLIATGDLANGNTRSSTILIQSFDASSLERIKALAPSLPTAFLLQAPNQTTMPWLVSGDGPDYIDAFAPNSVNLFADPTLVERLHANGHDVHTWTVNDRQQMDLLLGMGVDGIFTNNPDVLRAAIDARASGTTPEQRGNPADFARGCPGVAGRVASNQGPGELWTPNADGRGVHRVVPANPGAPRESVDAPPQDSRYGGALDLSLALVALLGVLRRRAVPAACLLLAACGDSAPKAPSAPPEPPGDPVVPAPALSRCDPYAGPAAAELEHFEGLMHEHSAYSDGDPQNVPADYYRIARDAGYTYAGGSEHSDSLDAGNFLTLHASCDLTSGEADPAALEYCFLNPDGDKLQKWNATLAQASDASGADFLAIRGFEWTSDVFGHINVYFSKNFTNAKNDGGYALSMETFWDWFTRDADTPGIAGAASSPVPYGGGADGLAHFNHPHDKCLTKKDPSAQTTGWCDWNDYTLVPAAEPRMFGMELYNDGNREDRYQPYYVRALDRGWHLAPVGSEDEHFAQYAVEHRPKTVTIARSLGEADFREAWLARRTYALSPGQHLRAALQADHQAPMGARLSCDSATTSVPMTVSLTQADGSPFVGEYHLFTNGGEELAVRSGSEVEFQLPVVRDQERWYFVRAHAVGGPSVAYLSPVWVTGK